MRLARHLAWLVRDAAAYGRADRRPGILVLVGLGLLLLALTLTAKTVAPVALYPFA